MEKKKGGLSVRCAWRVKKTKTCRCFKPQNINRCGQEKYGYYLQCVEVKSHHRFEPRGVELFVGFGWAGPMWNLTSLSSNSGGLHWLKVSVQQLSQGQSPVLIISAPFTVRSHAVWPGSDIYFMRLFTASYAPVNNMTGDTGSSGWMSVCSIGQ